MQRPITIISNQWLDLSLEDFCVLIKEWGYDGIELSEGHFDVALAATSIDYCKTIRKTIENNGLSLWAISGHLTGQCVGDLYDPRLDAFAPEELRGKPLEIRTWAIKNMKLLAKAAKNLGVQIITGFMGSSVWKYWYSFPATPVQMIDKAFEEIFDLWTPIFDVFDEYEVKFALEVHPSEIAFDYYTTQRLLEHFNWRTTLGLNFDPSHLLWQGVNPAVFLRDFASRIYHVHLKDLAINMDGKGGILGSHLEFGDLRRAWNFRSLGHGDVDFESIIRELNNFAYNGPLSVEWEDSGMERSFGAKESLKFAQSINFNPSSLAFDAFMKNK